MCPLDKLHEWIILLFRLKFSPVAWPLMICGLMQLGGMELILEVVIIKRIVRNYTVVTFPYFEIITVLENW